jgi:hypothetical protein
MMLLQLPYILELLLLLSALRTNVQKLTLVTLVD